MVRIGYLSIIFVEVEGGYPYPFSTQWVIELIVIVYPSDMMCSYARTIIVIVIGACRPDDCFRLPFLLIFFMADLPCNWPISYGLICCYLFVKDLHWWLDFHIDDWC